MKILDCTLRDGGYYNEWDFPPEVVTAYIEAMANSKIDYVELGLRNFSHKGFKGAFAYTTEDFINSLELPKGPSYGVMIDAKTILSSDLSIEDAINYLFVDSSESKVDLVRIAAHFHEVEESAPIVKALKGKGYIVGYNLMQAGGKSSEMIAEKAKIAKSWPGLDVLYFADSMGNMDGKEVIRIINSLRKYWDGELGIHTHDNMSKAIDNCLTAKNAGVKWLDVTVTGMGRGAGNAQTEKLLAIISQESDFYNETPVYKLVIKHFEAMKKEYGWGSSLLYFLGAQHNVHPTYIQNLLSNRHYGTDEIIGAIAYLSELNGASSYHGTVLETAMSIFNDGNVKVSGDDSLIGLFEEKNILVIGNGKSSEKYKEAIINYIQKANPIVLSININSSIEQKNIDYYIISHNSKFLADRQKYSKLQKPLILPLHRFSKLELSMVENNTIIDYGIEIINGELSANGFYTKVPYDTTFAYLTGVLLESLPKSIFLVGFDGYEKNDPRQQEMNEIIALYKSKKSKAKLISLTPTSYALEKGSIYAPI